MGMDLVTFTAGGLQKEALREIEEVNEYLRTAGGFTPSKKDALALVEARTNALRNYGRVEFGGGSIAMLARAFCTSPDITRDEFPSVLSELIEIFYAYKNETDYKISDAELIAAMRQAFDGSCHGSTELLATRGARMILRLALTGEEEENPDDAPLHASDDGTEATYG